MSVLPFLLQMSRPFKSVIFLSFMTSIIWAIDLSLRPYLIKRAIDTLTASTADAGFSFYIIAYFTLMTGVFISETIHEYRWVRFWPALQRRIGEHLFAVLLAHSYTFYQDSFAGSLAGKLQNCMMSAPRLIWIINEKFFRYSLAILLSSYIFLAVGLKFSIALFIWVLIYLSSAILLAPSVKKQSIQIAQEATKGTGHLIDALSNIISIKLFTQQDAEKKHMSYNLQQWQLIYNTRGRALVHLYAFQTLSFIAFQALCLYWLISEAGPSTQVAGNFILIFTVSFSIYNCLVGITRTIAEFSENWGNMSDTLSVFFAPIGIPDRPQAPALQASSHSPIQFQAVNFHYKGASSLFQNLSVTIAGGQKVGLVGYSGGGKSTFVNLILRLYEVIGGHILINGQDIRTVTQDSLRAHIAFIPQDPLLFHRSILENIRYGKPDATDAEVMMAAKQAHAHDFIMGLTHGYQSLIGERGIKLSGGQRQRIAIARAILKNAPILILDEATSQLDSLTEKEIQDSLWSLMQGKTVLVIAHRLSTLLHMDRLLIFENGRIVQDGRHAELVHKEGRYKMLWNTQVSGFLPDKIN